MERTTIPGEQPIRWKKVGGGSLRFIRNKIIKPGEVFVAKPSEIPAAFRDTVIPLDPLPKEVVAEELVPSPAEGAPKPGAYEMKKRDTSNWYDIFDASGKKVNEKALSKEKAEEMLASLK